MTPKESSREFLSGDIHFGEDLNSITSPIAIYNSTISRPTVDGPTLSRNFDQPWMVRRYFDQPWMVRRSHEIADDAFRYVQHNVSSDCMRDGCDRSLLFREFISGILVFVKHFLIHFLIHRPTIDHRSPEKPPPQCVTA